MTQSVKPSTSKRTNVQHPEHTFLKDALVHTVIVALGKRRLVDPWGLLPSQLHLLASSQWVNGPVPKRKMDRSWGMKPVLWPPTHASTQMCTHTQRYYEIINDGWRYPNATLQRTQKVLALSITAPILSANWMTSIWSLNKKRLCGPNTWLWMLSGSCLKIKQKGGINLDNIFYLINIVKELPSQYKVNLTKY